jgi:hypothetical protein
MFDSVTNIHNLPYGSSDRSFYSVVTKNAADFTANKWWFGYGVQGAGTSLDFGLVNFASFGDYLYTRWSSAASNFHSWQQYANMPFMAVMNYNGTSIRQNFNNRRFVSTTAALNTTLSASANRIGQYGGGSENWPGDIGEIISYNRTLSS